LPNLLIRCCVLDAHAKRWKRNWIPMCLRLRSPKLSRLTSTSHVLVQTIPNAYHQLYMCIWRTSIQPAWWYKRLLIWPELLPHRDSPSCILKNTSRAIYNSLSFSSSKLAYILCRTICVWILAEVMRRPLHPSYITSRLILPIFKPLTLPIICCCRSEVNRNHPKFIF
jgi:hypothetical protein